MEGKELKTDGTDDTLLDSTHINVVLFTFQRKSIWLEQMSQREAQNHYTKAICF